MEQLFKYHLRKRTYSQVNWYLLFQEWKENNCQIIELHSRLDLLYSDGYIFSEREIQAWRAILRAIRCVNITPFDKKESEVGYYFLIESIARLLVMIDVVMNVVVIDVVIDVIIDVGDGSI